MDKAEDEAASRSLANQEMSNYGRDRMRTSATVKRQEEKTKKKNGAKRRLRLWLAAVLLVGVWAGFMFYSQASDIKGREAELAQIRGKQKAVEESLNQVKYEVSRLNDPEYIGQLARKKYGLYKPGETPIRKSADGE